MTPSEELDPDQDDWRHLELSCALPHPWFADQLARALGVSPTRLARPEPQGWRERAIEGFDVAAALAELRSIADPDPARVDLLERMLAAKVTPRDWMIWALPIPPAKQRERLESAYARVLARSDALGVGWTATGERALAQAIARLFGPWGRRPSLGRRLVGREDRLVFEAWVPGAIAGTPVPDPDLDLDQLGLPYPLADALGLTEELLVLIREAPTHEAVLSLRPVAIAAEDHALRVSPLLLAAMAERAGLDACELELVVGRGRKLAHLGPSETLFARPFAHGLLLPESAALTVLAASLSRTPDELGDRKARARLLERLGWVPDLHERTLRLERAQEVLRASLDELTREGSSLCYDDLRDPLGDIDDATADSRENVAYLHRSYDAGEFSRGELRWQLDTHHQRWVSQRNRAVMGDFRVWDAPEGPEFGAGTIRSPLLRGWASLDPHKSQRLFVGPGTELACSGIPPCNLVTAVDPHTYFASAQIARGRPHERMLARAKARRWERVSLAALRSAATVEDCGASGHDSAATKLVREEAPTLAPLIEHPPLPRPIPPGVLGCRTTWVCERCWTSVATGQATVRPERAGIELGRIMAGLRGRWCSRDWTDYVPHHRGPYHIIAGPGRVRLRSNWADPRPHHVPRILEVTSGETTQSYELYGRCYRVLVDDGADLPEPALVVRDGCYERVELDVPIACFETGNLQYDVRFDEISRELDYFGLTGKPFGYLVVASFGQSWHTRLQSLREWRVVLGEPARPTELRAPFAGHLRIRSLDRSTYELRIETPARDDQPARVWTAESPTDVPFPYPHIKDDVDVYEYQPLTQGYFDARAHAERDPDGVRWWALEVLLGMSLYAHACVDWRALELCARIMTTPSGSFSSLLDVLRSRGDLLARMRADSMFEALRDGVLAS